MHSLPLQPVCDRSGFVTRDYRSGEHVAMGETAFDRTGAQRGTGSRIVACMPRRSAQANDTGHQSGSVENALRTFQLLRDRRSIRVAELAPELGVARSTAHRLLAQLSSYGAVEQEPGSPTYRPGPLLGQLGLSSLRQH